MWDLAAAATAEAATAATAKAATTATAKAATTATAHYFHAADRDHGPKRIAESVAATRRSKVNVRITRSTVARVAQRAPDEKSTRSHSIEDCRKGQFGDLAARLSLNHSAVRLPAERKNSFHHRPEGRRREVGFASRDNGSVGRAGRQGVGEFAVNNRAALKVMTADRTSAGNWVPIRFLASYLNYVPAVDRKDSTHARPC